MERKLAQIPPEIWMTLPLESKKWLLNERKRLQQEDDKMKKSLALPSDSFHFMERVKNGLPRVRSF
jgi:hypothetical protein